MKSGGKGKKVGMRITSNTDMKSIKKWTIEDLIWNMRGDKDFKELEEIARK